MERIDYVVPTWNSESTLELALASIRNYGRPNRIIVVDKRSGDLGSALVRQWADDTGVPVRVIVADEKAYVSL